MNLGFGKYILFKSGSILFQDCANNRDSALKLTEILEMIVGAILGLTRRTFTLYSIFAVVMVRN